VGKLELVGSTETGVGPVGGWLGSWGAGEPGGGNWSWWASQEQEVMGRWAGGRVSWFSV
jgi:hypothetical protein